MAKSIITATLPTLSAVPLPENTSRGSRWPSVATITPWSISTRATPTPSVSTPPVSPRRSTITPSSGLPAAARATIWRTCDAVWSMKVGMRTSSTRRPWAVSIRDETADTVTGWRTSVSSSGRSRPGRTIRSRTGVPGAPCISSTAST